MSTFVVFADLENDGSLLCIEHLVQVLQPPTPSRVANYVILRSKHNALYEQRNILLHHLFHIPGFTITRKKHILLIMYCKSCCFPLRDTGLCLNRAVPNTINRMYWVYYNCLEYISQSVIRRRCVLTNQSLA